MPGANGPRTPSKSSSSTLGTAVLVENSLQDSPVLGTVKHLAVAQPLVEDRGTWLVEDIPLRVRRNLLRVGGGDGHLGARAEVPHRVPRVNQQILARDEEGHLAAVELGPPGQVVLPAKHLVRDAVRDGHVRPEEVAHLQLGRRPGLLLLRAAVEEVELRLAPVQRHDDRVDEDHGADR